MRDSAWTEEDSGTDSGVRSVWMAWDNRAYKAEGAATVRKRFL